MTSIQKGILAALGSNILFGVLYIYSDWLKPLNGTEVFAWRMVMMLFGLMVLMFLLQGWRDLFQFCRGLGKDIKRWAMFVLPTSIVASQLWLFMWGPVNGYGVDVAMGYFLFPLMMVLAGRVILNERLTPLQTAAVTMALIAVGNEFFRTHTFSWVTAWIFGTYPIYYLMRRILQVPALAGLTLDLTIIFPFALFYLYLQDFNSAILQVAPLKFGFLLIMLGVISAAAMYLNLLGMRLLPVTIFGMLSYLEPTILFALAVLVLKEPLQMEAALTYGCIAVALVLMLLDGYRRLLISRKLAAKQSKLSGISET